MITLTASVGRGSVNHSHDVAILHAALKLITAEKPKVFRGVRGEVDGRLNFFQADLHFFLVELAGLRNYEGGIIGNVKPAGVNLKDINKLLPAGKMNDVRAIQDTGVLYVSSSSANGGSSKGGDFLMPKEYEEPLFHALSFIPFKYVFKNMRLPEDDFLRFDISFPGTKYLHEETLKRGTRIPKPMILEIRKRLKKTPWKLDSDQSEIGISFITRKKTELRRLFLKLDQFGPVNRVFRDKDSALITIKPKNEVMMIAGQIWAQICAASGQDGGTVRTTEKLRDRSRGFLGTTSEKRVEIHCDSCRKLGTDLRAFDLEIRGLLKELENPKSVLDRMMDSDTVVQNYKRNLSRAREARVSLLFNSIPGMVLDAKAFAQGEIKFSESDVITETLALISDIVIELITLGIIVVSSGTAILTARLVLFLIELYGFLKIAEDGLDLLVARFHLDSIERMYVERTKEILNEYAIYIENTFIRLQDLEISSAEKAKDFAARGCGIEFIGIGQNLES